VQQCYCLSGERSFPPRLVRGALPILRRCPQRPGSSPVAPAWKTPTGPPHSHRSFPGRSPLPGAIPAWLSSADASRLTLTLLPYRDRSSPFPLRTGRGRLTNPPGRAKPSCPSDLSDRRPLPGAVPVVLLVHGDLRPPSELPTRRDRSFLAMEFDWLAKARIVSFLATTCGVAHLRGSRRSIAHKWPSRPPAVPDFIPSRWCGILPQPGPSVC
jgi:hypothetical protein